MQPLSSPWRKSTYSTNGGQDCVETATANGQVLIRDTTDRAHGPVLSLTPRAFADLTARLRRSGVR